MPLGFLAHGERLIVSSFLEAAYPAWYHNLVAHPAVIVEVGSETFEATATALTGEDRERLWAWVIQQWPLLVEHQAKTSLLLPLVVISR